MDAFEYSINGFLLPSELVQLLKLAGMNTYSEERINRMLAGSTNYITCRKEKELIGFGRIISDNSTIAYINNMAVNPEYQRQKIGETILRKLIKIAENVVSIYLYTNTADKFYLKNGFRLSEKRLYIFKNENEMTKRNK
jgi:N-acetylglutamate synthase-like GNAT family acetyltransferase